MILPASGHAEILRKIALPGKKKISILSSPDELKFHTSTSSTSFSTIVLSSKVPRLRTKLSFHLGLRVRDFQEVLKEHWRFFSANVTKGSLEAARASLAGSSLAEVTVTSSPSCGGGRLEADSNNCRWWAESNL